MSEWSAPVVKLLELQRRFERGPKREGAFALWLLLRVALDMADPEIPFDKTERHRVDLLAQRLAPLAVPRPLARGLVTALGHLQEGTPAASRIALTQLVAPTRDALGVEAAGALMEAVQMMGRV